MPEWLTEQLLTTMAIIIQEFINNARKYFYQKSSRYEYISIKENVECNYPKVCGTQIFIYFSRLLNILNPQLNEKNPKQSKKHENR